MNIGIIGAQGSGKSVLAKELKFNLDEEPNGDCVSCKTIIVDDYVDDLGKEVDLAIGLSASYIGNLYVMMGRFAQERQAQSKRPKHIVTCGTLIETSVYASLEAVMGQSEAHWVRINNFMNTLGSFYQDTFRYKPLFYLPLENPNEETEEAKVDQAIPVALDAFGWPYETLPAEDRGDKAMEIVNATLAEYEAATAQ